MRLRFWHWGSHRTRRGNHCTQVLHTCPTCAGLITITWCPADTGDIQSTCTSTRYRLSHSPSYNEYIDNEYLDISTEFATFEAITELNIKNNNNKIKIYNERIKKITRKNPRNYRKQTLECYGRNRL